MGDTKLGIEQAHRIGKKLSSEIRSEYNLIIVSHDGVLSIFYALWLGIELEMLDKYNISGKTGGVSIMQEDDEGNHILLKLNDMTYIQN